MSQGLVIYVQADHLPPLYIKHPEEGRYYLVREIWLDAGQVMVQSSYYLRTGNCFVIKRLGKREELSANLLTELTEHPKSEERGDTLA